MDRARSIALGGAVAAVALGGCWLAFGTAGRFTHTTPLLGGLSAAIWAIAALAEARAGRAIPAVTPVFAGLALAASLLILGPDVPGAVRGDAARGWSTYHYYVGSKYFADTGYFDLYAATLAADDAFVAAGGDPKAGWWDAVKARDMRTYRLRPRAEIVGSFDASRMAPERLAALGEDSRWFLRHEAPKDRRKLVQDLGYNPAPPWLLLGLPMTRAIEPGGPGFGLITGSDLAMHAVLFAALWWGFGLRVACIALLWLLAMPVNRTRLLGGFFNYDWLAASALGLAAWRRGRPGLAGTALAWAAMTRVFPGLLALPALAAARRDPKARRFALVFCGLCALLFGASHLTGRGAATWPEWAEKISIHSEHHPSTGSKRVGLGRLVLHHPRPGKFWRATSRPSKAQAASSHRRKLATGALGLGLLGFALRKRSVEEAMLLMLFAAWIGSTSSRYYASIWVLLFCLPTAGPRAGPGRVAGGCLMLMLVLFQATPTLTARYLALNYEALAMFSALCLAFLIGDRAAGPQVGPRTDEEGSAGRPSGVRPDGAPVR